MIPPMAVTPNMAAASVNMALSSVCAPVRGKPAYTPPSEDREGGRSRAAGAARPRERGREDGDGDDHGAHQGRQEDDHHGHHEPPGRTGQGARVHERVPRGPPGRHWTVAGDRNARNPIQGAVHQALHQASTSTDSGIPRAAAGHPRRWTSDSARSRTKAYAALASPRPPCG